MSDKLPSEQAAEILEQILANKSAEEYTLADWQLVTTHVVLWLQENMTPDDISVLGMLAQAVMAINARLLLLEAKGHTE